jgi:ppGpp synthetase/RelA/SpoT-type nucleotidyltranferase
MEQIMSSKSPEEWGQIYKGVRNKYEKFGGELDNLMRRLLEAEAIEAQVTFRVKTVESFTEKIKRKKSEGKDYNNPLEEITDIVGIRIITYYLGDVIKIGDLVKKEFQIDYENSLDKSELLESDRFGYLSVHYIISLSSPRKDTTEWKIFDNIQSEIQIRTILQHAWAEIDHKLRYKQDDALPKDLKRQLYRLIALFELADLEFENLRERTEAIKGRYLKDISDGMVDLELNLFSLDEYFKLTHLDQEWMDLSNKIIYDLLSNKSQRSDLKDLENTCAVSINVEKSYQDLRYKAYFLTLMSRLGVTNLGELDTILRSASNWGEDVLKEVYDYFIEKFVIEKVKEGMSVCDIQLDPYRNIAILVLYEKRDVLNRNTKILEDMLIFPEIKEAIKSLIDK